MTTSAIPHPRVVSRELWRAERKELLAHEKELTKHYVFDGPAGKASL